LIKRVAFIGTGRIAWSLAEAFKEAGYEVVCAISRTGYNLINFAARFRIDCTIRSFDEMKSALAEPALVLIAVPDSEIRSVAEQLTALDLPVEGSMFVHLSGSKNSDELSALSSKGALTGTLHIPQSFPTTDPIPIRGLPAAIESVSSVGERLLFEVAHILGLIPISVKQEGKIFYHLAAVFASNFFPVLVADSMKMFEAAGGKRDDYFKIFSSIITTTFNNILQNGPENAVSGVVSRRDEETIRRHISALLEFESQKRDVDLHAGLDEKDFHPGSGKKGFNTEKGFNAETGGSGLLETYKLLSKRTAELLGVQFNDESLWEGTFADGNDDDPPLKPGK